jgi:hypothetical protein
VTWPPPESLLDALVGAIVGGILTGLGAFGGILYVRSQDERAAKKRFVAAVLIVLDELGVNEVNIENLIRQTFGPPEFYDATYRSVELVLATRLRPADRQLLAEAYAPLRARWAAEDPAATPSDQVVLRQMNVIAPDRERLGRALEKIRAARRALATYVGKLLA